MYDAFISYRHTPLDQFVAQNLHKKLEAFRLPSSLVKQRGGDCKKKIERVFRDRDELPLASNLADPITQALKDSEFLIVICSPRLPQSQWCRKEIETFMDMHGRDRILAVLIEGEPEDSFPEELLYRKREVTQADGSVQVIREPVEPLAADMRGKTKREILKAMDGELLRLAAAMFGCAYDDLKQRHKEQKMKRMLSVSLAASSVFLIFGAVSAAMAFRIQMQKEQIQAQSDEIAGQKEHIEIQYREALENQSRSLAEKSLGLLEEGDRLGAIQTALEAFRDLEDGTSMPVTSEAQYALAESTYVYQDGYGVIPQYMLKHDSNVVLMTESPNGKLLLTGDAIGNLYVWDVQANKQLYRLMTDESLSVSGQEKCAFLTDDRIIYPTGEGYEIFDLESGESVLSANTFYYKAVQPSQGQKWFAVVAGNVLSVYDTESLQVCSSYEFPEGTTGSEVIRFDEERELLFFGKNRFGASAEPGSAIVVMHIPDGTIEQEFRLEYSEVAAILCRGDILYAGTKESIIDFDETGKGFSDSFASKVYCLSLQDGSRKWKYEYEDGYLQELQFSGDESRPDLLALFYSDAVFLDPYSGTQKQSFHYGREIVQGFQYKGQDAYAILTRGGEYWYLSGDYEDTILLEGFFQANSENVQDCVVTEAGFLLLAYDSNQITCLDQVAGSGMQVMWEEMWDEKKGFQEVTTDDTEKRMLILHVSREVSLMDLETNQKIAEFGSEDGISIAGFVGDGSEYLYCVDGENISFYRVEDGSFYQSCLLPEYFWYTKSRLTSDREHLILEGTSGGSYVLVDLVNGEMEEADLPVNWDYAVRAVMGNTLSIYAVADHQENCVMLYQAGSDQSYASLPANGAYVSELLFTENDQYLLVVYRNNSVDVFDLETEARVATLDNLEVPMESVIQEKGQEGYILRGSGVGYVVDAQWKTRARITGFVGMEPQQGRYFITRSDTLYALPVYSVDMLIEEGKRIVSSLNAGEDGN